MKVLLCSQPYKFRKEKEDNTVLYEVPLLSVQLGTSKWSVVETMNVCTTRMVRRDTGTLLQC